MLGFILFGGVFGAYTSYELIGQCRAGSEIAPLTAKLESRGVLLEEWDGFGPKQRVNYLKRMHQLQDKFEDLAERSHIFRKLLEQKQEFYSIVNKMALLNEIEVNGILYRVLYLMMGGKICDCVEFCKCDSIATNLYSLLMKIKN